ncbi:MAG: hypothetical protein H0X37_17620 [Herpetosiphonaceae bacterium]|nr:hypothetical protein [Herpetosiphonaceae bacterium]
MLDLSVAERRPAPSLLGAILLLLLTYVDRWITGIVPGIGQWQPTLLYVLTVGLVLVYVLVTWSTDPSASTSMKRRARTRCTMLMTTIIALNVLLPMGFFIHDRLVRGPYPQNVIDWPLQIEAGSNLLLQSKSPYGYDYALTEMKLWSERANFPGNPALHHAIHLPMNFLLAAVVLPVWRALFGWTDARILLIPAYVLVIVFAPRLCDRWEDGHALRIILALNPILVDSFEVGLSDYLLLALLIATFTLRRSGRTRAAAAMLGVAVATRQFSWLLVPAYLAAEWWTLPEQPIRVHVGALTRRVWPLFAVVSAVILPFLLLDGRNFYADVIAFGSGGVTDAYPIGGLNTFGISAFVAFLQQGLGYRFTFPWMLVQLAAVLPVLGYTIVLQCRHNTLRRLVLSYGVVLAIFMFTGRFMHTNYLGFLFAILVLAYFTADTPLNAPRPESTTLGVEHGTTLMTHLTIQGT